MKLTSLDATLHCVLNGALGVYFEQVLHEILCENLGHVLAIKHSNKPLWTEKEMTVYISAFMLALCW